MDRIKISCIVMLICLWISTDVWAQEVIHVEVAGTLPVLIGDKKETVEELTLTGKLNGTDIKCIREMKKLRTLDMNGTEILKSDIVYYVEPYTANGEHVIKTDDEIGDYMFYQLSTLENIILPDKAYKIGTYALGECEKLKSVTIPDGVTEIGTLSFYMCLNLRNITLPENLKKIGNSCFSQSALEEIVIPNSVDTLRNHSFAWMNNLQRVTFPTALKCIEYNAFYKCPLLQEALIPEHTLAIEKEAFFGCRMLNKLSLPVGIENIGAYAFSECSLLSSVIIPNNFVRIGGAAFSRTGLTSVEVPEGITSIESSTFYLCEKLKTVSLPESLHSIRSDAFRQCKTLESIRISENVDSIGSNSFQGCIGLKEVVIQGGNTDLVIEWGTFGDCGFEDIVLPDRLTYIGHSVFMGCSNLKKITLPKGITVIEHSLFQGTSLVKLEIPDGVTKIEESAFHGCLQLEELKLPDIVKTIGENAFYSCGKLSDVNIPAQLEKLGDYAFLSCNSLETVVLPNSLTYMGAACFEGCSGLLNIKLPDRLVSIESSCFKGCRNLQEIKIPDSVIEIGYWAFRDCSKLKEVLLPKNLKRIKSLTFAGCSQLEAIEIPEGCVAILDNAFSGCANLVYVSVPSTVTQMEDYVFDGCANMGSIVWNSELEIKSSFFADVQPCNCLLYVSQGTVLPETWNDNIVRENVAEQVVFNAGYSCYVARELKAKHITYTREFTLPTKKGTAAGWTSVVLPFTVQEFTHESKGKLSPFGATEIGSKPFWLRELASHGFKNVAALEANKPYIIAMPNNSDEYEEQYNISGCVQFEAADEAGVMIPATPSVMPTGENALYELVPTLRSVSKTNRVYALSQEEHGDFPAGSLFVSCLRDIDPFEAYVVTKESATNAPLYYSIGGEGGEITGLEEILKKEDESLKIYTAGNVLYIDSDRDRSISIYDVTGRIVRIVEVHEGSNTVTGLSSGFYFLEGKKVAIK